MESLSEEYDLQIRALIEAQTAWNKALARLDLLRASLPEEEARKIDILHGLEWVEGRPTAAKDPWAGV